MPSAFALASSGGGHGAAAGISGREHRVHLRGLHRHRREERGAWPALGKLLEGRLRADLHVRRGSAAGMGRLGRRAETKVYFVFLHKRKNRTRFFSIRLTIGFRVLKRCKRYGRACRTAYFGQYKCYGPGANTTGRVAWSHNNLTSKEVEPFLSKGMIDGRTWIGSDTDPFTTDSYYNTWDLRGLNSWTTIIADLSIMREFSPRLSPIGGKVSRAIMPLVNTDRWKLHKYYEILSHWITIKF